MSCIKGCSSDTGQVNFTTESGFHILSVGPTDEPFVAFSAGEKLSNRKVNSNGDIQVAGSGHVTQEFSVVHECTDAAKALMAAWVAATPALCGRGEVISDCCNGVTSYRSLVLDNVTQPEISDDVSYFKFDFFGVIG